MSTREPPGVPPAEAGILSQQVPQPSQMGTQGVGLPTPGIALAAGRVPMAPTLPDWDPSMFAGQISELANALFKSPPAAPSGSDIGVSGAAPATSVVPERVPVTGAQSVPALSAPLASAPVGPGTETPLAGVPLTGAPLVGGPTASVPLLSSAPQALPAPIPGAPASPFHVAPSFGSLTAFEVPALSLPLFEGASASTDAPYWLMPAATDAQTASAAVLPFEVQPVADLQLRQNAAGTAFDPYAIRRQFPILNERVNGHRLVWLDNAATTQKPQVVIDRLKHFYEHENSNIHRAAHTLAARATDSYESARESVRRFINAPSKNEVVFVRGTTEGINLVAKSWGMANIGEGDEIIVSHLEHHANIVPWQQLAKERGAKLKVIPVDDSGQVILEDFERLLGPKTKLVAFTQVSNALGTVTPARQMIEMAHRHGAKVLLDGAQSVSHMPVDVQALDADFFVFSGHKVFAPTGIGVVYGKKDLLEAMPPWQGGGNMIQDVTFERSLFQPPPFKFEAGTGNIADAIGLGAALDWLMRIGVANVGAYEHELLVYATEQLKTVPGLRLIGTSPDKAGVLSFVLAGQKTEEVGGLLDKDGIAVRSGHHCAQPILRRFGVEASVRASLAPYNTVEDIDALVAALKRLQAGKQ